eukprot:1996059-Rhodomonas_salina.3
MESNTQIGLVDLEGSQAGCSGMLSASSCCSTGLSRLRVVDGSSSAPALVCLRGGGPDTLLPGRSGCRRAGTVWRRTGSSSDDAPLYKLPLDSDVGVFILNNEQIVDAASLQVRLSAQDANNALGASDVKQALGSFCKAPTRAELLPMTAASGFVVLARREAAQGLSMKMIRPSEYFWETCNEVCCLADHDLMRIVPYSLRLRPNLQIRTTFATRCEFA